MEKGIKRMLLVIVILGTLIGAMSMETPLQQATPNIAVLGYHHLASQKDKNEYFRLDPWTTSVDVFEKQMAYLYDHGYHTITLDTLYEWYLGHIELDNKSVVLTFDDSYYSTYVLAKPILEKYGFSATCFVIGISIPDKETYKPPTKQHIPKALLEDDDILQYASHFHHLHRKINHQYAVNTYTKEKLKKDVRLAGRSVSNAYMAYPFGKCNETVKEVLKEEHIKMAFTYQNYHKMTRQSDVYALPRFAIHAYTPMVLFRYYLNQSYHFC